MSHLANWGPTREWARLTGKAARLYARPIPEVGYSLVPGPLEAPRERFLPVGPAERRVCGERLQLEAAPESEPAQVDPR